MNSIFSMLVLVGVTLIFSIPAYAAKTLFFDASKITESRDTWKNGTESLDSTTISLEAQFRFFGGWWRYIGFSSSGFYNKNYNEIYWIPGLMPNIDIGSRINLYGNFMMPMTVGLNGSEGSSMGFGGGTGGGIIYKATEQLSIKADYKDFGVINFRGTPNFKVISVGVGFDW